MKEKEKLEIDEVATLKNLLQATVENERLYFELLSHIDDYKKSTDLVTKNITRLSITDQIKILKINRMLGKTCEMLCEKYDFEEEATDND